MAFYNQNKQQVISALTSSETVGLNDNNVIKNRIKYGKNVLTKNKGKPLIKKILEALSEPMLIILEFAFFLTIGINIGKFIKSGDGDLTECIGILIAISISVVLNLVMESRSQKAFELLNNLSENSYVKVIRNGDINLINQKEVVVGDIVLLENGDKVVADGRILSSNDLQVDESMLTGESKFVKKNNGQELFGEVALAERVNFLFSGTYVTNGTAKMIVTSVGDNAELGKIAKGLKNVEVVSAPIQEKLSHLSKVVTIIGGISACFVFVLSFLRLLLTNNVSFLTVQDVFVESIVLIVASVPEGLPTTVAISLTLNVLKLAKSNALIKKLVASETVGAVSVICSDKTGTLTQNKMVVEKICKNDFCVMPSNLKNQYIVDNIAINSSSHINKSDGTYNFIGQPTECALLVSIDKSGFDYKSIRNLAKIKKVEPFSSDKKYMKTTVLSENGYVTYVKGAPEVLLDKCELTKEQKNNIIYTMEQIQKNAKRIIAFAHSEYDKEESVSYIYDGYAVISDPIRSDVKEAINVCKNAGIEVKILTGDNSKTAIGIARELNLITSESEVITAEYIENIDDDKLMKVLPKIKVIARSLPSTKLRIVSLLKKMGEVVAVTGDGVNDAPAIKNADIGIAMGSGSEITKEASDIILLDNSFSTIVKAISFGRNVFDNFQRFIVFQLSVNVCAMSVVIVSLIFGFENPFNSLQLLWINIIMDGPPALTLGLEMRNNENMNRKPINRGDSILTKKMLAKIFINGEIMSFMIIFQMLFNYLEVDVLEQNATVFTTFVVLQLFNAFNSRELGVNSIFKNITQNSLMLIVFTFTFLLQVVIVQCFGFAFGVSPLSLFSWIKITLLASLIIFFSEIYKLFYKIIKKRQNKRKLALNY